MKYSFDKYRMRLATALFVAVPFLFQSCGERDKESPSLEVYESLREVSRLELAKMTIGKVGMVSDPSWDDANTIEGKALALFNSMKVGKRIGVYSYDTYVTAFVDLSKLQPDDVVVDEENATVDIYLPSVEVMTDGREPQLHEEHYRVTGFRSRITPEERAALKTQMAREVKREMAASKASMETLRKSAEQKARAWISGLAADRGLTANVNFR